MKTAFCFSGIFSVNFSGNFRNFRNLGKTFWCKMLTSFRKIISQFTYLIHKCNVHNTRVIFTQPQQSPTPHFLHLVDFSVYIFILHTVLLQYTCFYGSLYLVVTFPESVIISGKVATTYTEIRLRLFIRYIEM